jgi:transposase-like protein
MNQFGIGFHTTSQKRRNYEFVVDDETLINVGNELVWVWAALELKSKTMLGICKYLMKAVCLLQRILYDY